MIETIHIYEALRKIKDPITGQDVVTAGRIQQLEVEGEQVNFTLALPNVEAQTKSDLNFACMNAIQAVYPKAQIHIHNLTKNPQAGGSGATPNALPQVKNIIAVASGKGGVGKSTVAVNLALGLQKMGATVGLLDADVYGPSIPTMLGLQGQRPKVEQLYGKPRILPLEAHGLQTISIGFIIEPEQAVVLRGPRLGGIIRQFFNEVLWQPLDFLVVDLPPGTGDVQLTMVQTVSVTGAVMVTTPQRVAVADAIKAMNMFRLPSVDVPILGVVENMSWFTPAELPDHRYPIFGQGGGRELAKASNSMLLGQIPLVQSVREGGDSGRPALLGEPSAATEAILQMAQNVIRQVNLRNEMLGPTQPVQMMP